MKLKLLVFCCVVLAAGASVGFSQGKTSIQYLDDASRFYLVRDYERAIPPYEKALQLEKKERKLSKELWIVLVDNLAMAYGMTGKIDSSQKVLAYGIQEEPTYPLFYYNMACGFGERDNEAGAVENLRLGFKYRDNMIAGEKFPDPETDSSFERLMKRESFRKAVEEMKNGSPAAASAGLTWGCAERDYKCQLDSRMKAMQDDPKNPENYYNFGLVFLRVGNPTQAVQSFDLYLSIPGVKPELRAEGYNNRGIAYRQLKRYDLASADYSKAIELNPKNAIFFLNRANVRSDLNRPDDAMADYGQAIALDAKYAAAYANRGHLFAARSKNDEALKDLNVAIDMDPASPEPFYTRAMVNRAKRDFAAAIRDLDGYIERIPANDRYLADAYLNRGIAYSLTNKPDLAEKDFTKAIELSPGYAEAYQARALIYRQAKKIAQAEADERKAAELSTKQPK